VSESVENNLEHLLTVFLPGLGADATLARFHPVQGESIWLQWPNPIPANWNDFAHAMIRQIPAHRPLRLVGISFGGIAALEIARRMRPEGGVWLIGSLEDRSSLRPLFRILLPLVPWIPRPLFDLRWLPKAVVGHFFGIRDPKHLVLFGEMAARLGPRSVKGLCRLVATWWSTDLPAAHRIHGRKDRILRPPTGEVRMVEGGHLISMTHAEEINEWLEQTPQ